MSSPLASVREVIAVAQDLDLAGRGQHTLGQQSFPKQGVEKGGLARVELADHHQQEDLVQLLQGALEQIHICVRCVQASQETRRSSSSVRSRRNS